MPYMPQSEIIERFNAYLNYHNLSLKLGEAGVCHGLSTLFAKYHLEGKTSDFFQTLNFVANKLKSNDEFDIKLNHFFMQVLLSQSPKGFVQNMNQKNSNELLELPTNCNFALNASINQWAEIFAKINLSENEVMRLSSIGHSVAVTKQDGSYMVYDPNYESGFKIFKTEQALAKELSKNVMYYKGKDLGLNISILENSKPLTANTDVEWQDLLSKIETSPDDVYKICNNKKVLFLKKTENGFKLTGQDLINDAENNSPDLIIKQIKSIFCNGNQMLAMNIQKLDKNEVELIEARKTEALYEAVEHKSLFSYSKDKYGREFNTFVQQVKNNAPKANQVLTLKLIKEYKGTCKEINNSKSSALKKKQKKIKLQTDAHKVISESMAAAAASDSNYSASSLALLINSKLFSAQNKQSMLENAIKTTIYFGSQKTFNTLMLLRDNEKMFFMKNIYLTLLKEQSDEMVQIAVKGGNRAIFNDVWSKVLSKSHSDAESNNTPNLLEKNTLIKLLGLHADSNKDTNTLLIAIKNNDIEILRDLFSILDENEIYIYKDMALILLYQALNNSNSTTVDLLFEFISSNCKPLTVAELVSDLKFSLNQLKNMPIENIRKLKDLEYNFSAEQTTLINQREHIETTLGENFAMLFKQCIEFLKNLVNSKPDYAKYKVSHGSTFFNNSDEAHALKPTDESTISNDLGPNK